MSEFYQEPENASEETPRAEEQAQPEVQWTPPEDPAPEELQGRKLAIRYCRRKPWRYEVIS